MFRCAAAAGASSNTGGVGAAFSWSNYSVLAADDGGAAAVGDAAEAGVCPLLPSESVSAVVLALAGTAVLALCLNIAEMMLIESTSALCMNIASTAKVSAVILMSMVLFDTPLTASKGIGALHPPVPLLSSTPRHVMRGKPVLIWKERSARKDRSAGRGGAVGGVHTLRPSACCCRRRRRRSAA